MPATTTTTTVDHALGLALVSPAGFYPSYANLAAAGPVDPSNFDFYFSPGEAPNAGVEGAYVQFLDQTGGLDRILIGLAQFYSAAQAQQYRHHLTTLNIRPAGGTQKPYPAIPGALANSYPPDAKFPDYSHDVVAAKGARVMIVVYLSKQRAVPAGLDPVAAEQYAQL